MIQAGQICGVVGCTDHDCRGCVRLHYAGQLMPAECAVCCFTEKCQFEPMEEPTE